MKKFLLLTLTAVCLLTLVLGLSSCGKDSKNAKSDEFVAIEGDKIVGTWIVGGTGEVTAERLEKIIPAYNGITELKKYEDVSEKDAVMRMVIFSDHGGSNIEIFKITYIGDNTFSIDVDGSSKASYNAVSEELYRAITEIIE